MLPAQSRQRFRGLVQLRIVTCPTGVTGQTALPNVTPALEPEQGCMPIPKRAPPAAWTCTRCNLAVETNPTALHPERPVEHPLMVLLCHHLDLEDPMALELDQGQGSTKAIQLAKHQTGVTGVLAVRNVALASRYSLGLLFTPGGKK